MAGFIAFPPQFPLDTLQSATGADGARMGGVVVPASNLGSLLPMLSGTPTSDISLKMQLLSEGAIGTAVYKASIDGGTNYKQRKSITGTWDGNGATDRTIFDGVIDNIASNCVAMDTDGDGVPDKIFTLVRKSNPQEMDLYATTDFSGAGSWTKVSSMDNGATSGCLLVVGSVLFAFCILPGGGSADASVSTDRSFDFGATWEPQTAYVTSGNAMLSIRPAACILNSGKIAVVYSKVVTSDTHLFIKTSVDGNTWSAGSQITPAGAVSYESPSIFQTPAGITVVFFRRSTATACVQARESTWIDPGSASATWSNYDVILWGGGATKGSATGTTDIHPYATLLPNGNAACVFVDTATDSIKLSQWDGAAANWNAEVEIFNPSYSVRDSTLSVVGGALFCTLQDYTNYKAQLVCSAYWEAYSGGSSWTSADIQFISSGVWCKWVGTYGHTFDYYTAGVVRDYGPHRMFMLRPSHPMKASHNQDFAVVYKMGDSSMPAFDTILCLSNLENIKVQLNSADSWTTPSVSKELSFVQETTAATISGRAVTRSSGGWTPHAEKGKWAKFGSNAPVLIVDNSATTLYCDATPSGSGDVKILTGRAWTTLTAARDTYLRILIPSQPTASGKYEVGALVLAPRTALTDMQRMPTFSWVSPVRDSRSDAGNIVRTVVGTHARRRGTMNLQSLTLAKYAEVSPLLRGPSALPFAYVPDDTRAADWMLLMPADTAAWSTRRTAVDVEEVV